MKRLFICALSHPRANSRGPGGTFPFEGGNVEYTSRKIIEYAGEEIGGVTIYWDVNTPLIAGDYTVELLPTISDWFRVSLIFK